MRLALARCMSSKSRHILVGVAIFVGLVCASAYLFRDTVATGAVRFALARSSKLHCTEPELDISAGLDRIQLADIECTVKDGKIEELRVTPESRRKDIVIKGAAE